MSQLNIHLQKALEKTFEYSQIHNHEFITPETLMLHVVDIPSVKETLEKLKVDVEQYKKDLLSYLDMVPRRLNSEDSPERSQELVQLIQLTKFAARSSSKAEVNPEEILHSLFHFKESKALYFLAKQGLTKLNLVTYLSKGLLPDDQKKIEPQTSETEEQTQEQNEKNNPLEAFAVNLNKKAAEGRIDPFIGRDPEIERVIQILCRRRKNNPLLVGEAGVGKTAIAEGLALRIQAGNVPEILKNCEVYSLDMGTLVAGTKYRGDFEQRIKQLINKVKNDSTKILFIDEIHTIIGAGSASTGSLDTANLLKPSLSNGEIRCIGATTYDEFRKFFEKEQALARRFQKVDVLEPSMDDTINILMGLKPQYEEHHNVKYSKEAIETIVKLSNRYITSGHFPDKAIDVFDEVGAFQRTLPPTKQAKVITSKEIEAVIAKIARIPAITISSSDKDKLKNLEQDLINSVFGQDNAATFLAKAIKRSRANLARANKPVGSFLFSGPTGVGKTEMVKQLSKSLGLELIRFDMSEYMEKHAVSKLIGSPPGYVGYEEGGVLTEKITKSPHCVLLLDEIEKAHPDIFNILLQVMDNAELTDNNGRKANFKNVILIMTSNVGAHASDKRPIGFGQNLDDSQNSERMSALKKAFTPEFRNRLDAIVQFNTLNEQTIQKIVDKLLMQLDFELREREFPVSVVYTDALKAYLAKNGYNPQMGARPLERLIQETLRDALTDELLFGGLEFGGEVEIDVDNTNPKDPKVVHRVLTSNQAPKKTKKTAN